MKDGYAWERLAPDGDCPKCGTPDCFKREPMYMDRTDTLFWACSVCGYEVETMPADRQETK